MQLPPPGDINCPVIFMITVKSRDDFEKEKITDLEGAKEVEKEVLLGAPEGVESFAMRRFTLAGCGHTPYHSHDWEHEVYVLEGKGVVKTEEGERQLASGSAVYVPSNEEHQFLSDEEGMKFLCLVPKRGEPTTAES